VVYGVEGVNEAGRAAGIAGDEWARPRGHEGWGGRMVGRAGTTSERAWRRERVMDMVKVAASKADRTRSSGGAMVRAWSSGEATVRGHRPSRGHARVSKGRGGMVGGGVATAAGTAAGKGGRGGGQRLRQQCGGGRSQGRVRRRCASVRARAAGSTSSEEHSRPGCGT
jgi:hypothetical protein